MNKLSSKTISPALDLLLERFIDYAGLFPPAKLPLGTCISNFDHYDSQAYSWMLRAFVITEAELSNAPAKMDGRLSILSESDNERAFSIESKSIIQSNHPVYCELATDQLEGLAKVKESACFAKIRTGGIKPEMIPDCQSVAAFILKCAELKLPFKATAGLHHPIRAQYPLTYEPDSAKARMHGFLNVVLASVFAWSGDRDIEPILAEEDAKAFIFTENKAQWRDREVSLNTIKDARANFIHSIGSCSFEEPVNELKALGLL